MRTGQHGYLVSLPSFLFKKTSKRNFQVSSFVDAKKQNHLTSQTHTHTFAFVKLTHVIRTKDRALRIYSCDKMTELLYNIRTTRLVGKELTYTYRGWSER